ncbi:MAG: HigA family addiction module antitoxin [Myxococcota bacterium]
MSTIQHPGAFIRHRFMEPLGLSASELSTAIGVPRSRLSEVLSGRRGVSVDTARRLALYFNVDLQVFLERQTAWDLAQLAPVHIDPADTQGFLVGPRGVTPIPEATRKPSPAAAIVSSSMLERLRAKAAETPKPGERREMVQTTYANGQRVLESKAQ